MDAYVWTRDLETGNFAIDSQHKELIAAMNALVAACNAGKGKEEVAKTLRFLSDYITKHFADEERLQQQSGYPGYPEHKKMHSDFRRKVGELALQYQKDGSTVTLAGHVNVSVSRWLLSHIKKEDAKVAAHIRNRKE